MSTIDQQFIEYIVKSLVGNPDAVSIERTIDEKGVLLQLTVDPQDLGRVIGKRGAGAQALRTLLRSLGTKNEARYNLKIVDNGEPRERREDYQPEQDQPHTQEKSDSPEQSQDTQDTPKPNAEDSSDDYKQDAEDDAPEEKSEHQSMADKTRQELGDLDDLDI